jgi:uncharacterized membrane protein (UPF0127 family)
LQRSRIIVGDKKKEITVKACENFGSKFLGLMFKSDLYPNEGILLVEKNESTIGTAIHMFFMRFDISVFWMDRSFRVVDKVLARAWRPFYSSKHPAQYVLETHPSQFDTFEIGEILYQRDV